MQPARWFDDTHDGELAVMEVNRVDHKGSVRRYPPTTATWLTGAARAVER
jgi:hypothetical protein